MQAWSLMPATSLKKRLWHSCFPVNFAKLLRTPFLTEPLRRLLLKYSRKLIIRILLKQKQLSRGILRKKYSENLHQIYRRTPMPKCDFSKAAKQLYWNHTFAWVFSCKFATYFQNNFLKEGCFFWNCWQIRNVKQILELLSII